mgnify:FL=1|jgi:methionine synthase II (cobalamin-independent)|tara:strand:- start:336 stop:497 length:162 start_codon:yes stop_codon:yes gene_type:complete
MVADNNTLEITQADIAEVLQQKINTITNLELQIVTLKRTIVELRSEQEESAEE